MKTTDQKTFWQFTVENAKEAVRLYFQPVRQVGAWLGSEQEPVDVRRLERLVQQEALRLEELRAEQGRQHESIDKRISKLKQNQDALEASLRDLENQLHPPFDSLENLDLRFKRLTAWLGTEAGAVLEAEVGNTVTTIATQLATAHLLAGSPHSEAEMERALSYIRQKLRQTEVYLGFEQPLPPRNVERTKGASGD
jgi:chromosome segregation ATPase